VVPSAHAKKVIRRSAYFGRVPSLRHASVRLRCLVSVSLFFGMLFCKMATHQAAADSADYSMMAHIS